MNREEKKVVIDSLAEKLTAYAHYYITDTSELNAEQTAALRKLCFEKEVKLVVAKNTLFIKALEQTGKINEESRQVDQGVPQGESETGSESCMRGRLHLSGRCRRRGTG